METNGHKAMAWVGKSLPRLPKQARLDHSTAYTLRRTGVLPHLLHFTSDLPVLDFKASSDSWESCGSHALMRSNMAQYLQRRARWNA
jgi:hypothetical protein